MKSMEIYFTMKELVMKEEMWLGGDLLETVLTNMSLCLPMCLLPAVHMFPHMQGGYLTVDQE